MNKNDNETKLIEKYINDEYGVKICDPNDLDIKHEGYMKLNDEAFGKVNAVLKEVPHIGNELKAQKLSTDCYKVIYNKGLGQLQQSAKNREYFHSNIVAFGTNNKITGSADLQKFEVKVYSPALAIFDIAAIATNQYYMARIDRELTTLNSKLDYVQKFLEESKKSDLWADGQILKDISGNISGIMQNDQYRQATLITVQGIRRDALSNVKFYHQMMNNYMATHLKKDEKDYSKVLEAINKFHESFEAYCYSIYVYDFSYVIEVALSGITDKEYISKVKKEIQSISDESQNCYTNELQQFIDDSKCLNPGKLTKFMSGNTLLHATSGFGLMGIVGATGVIATNLIANYDVDKKHNQKSEIVAEYKKIEARTIKSIEELETPLKALERLDNLYHKPVELLVDGGSLYLKTEEDLDETGDDLKVPDAPQIDEK